MSRALLSTFVTMKMRRSRSVRSSLAHCLRVWAPHYPRQVWHALDYLTFSIVVSVRVFLLFHVPRQHGDSSLVDCRNANYFHPDLPFQTCTDERVYSVLAPDHLYRW